MLDASAVADVLLRTERGREITPVVRAGAGSLHAPELLDAEVSSATRQAELRGAIDATRASEVLGDLSALPLARHPYRPLLPRAWELRRNFTVYDGLYVALAEIAEAPLLTTDARLRKAIVAHTRVELVDA